MSAGPRPLLRKCIATVALSGSLPDKLEAAARVGFDGVEVMEADLLAYDGSPADVRRIAADLGLAIDLYQPFRDFEAMPDPQRGRNLDRAERKFDIMQALGTDLVLVCSNTLAAALDDDARAAADLHAMAERAAQRGLRVGFEALSWGRHIRLWRHAWRIVQQADHPALGLIVDSFHTLALRDDPSGIADCPASASSSCSSPTRRCATWTCCPGAGISATSRGRATCRWTASCGPCWPAATRGPLSLEVFNDHFRAAPSEPDRAGRAALADPGGGAAPPATAAAGADTAGSSSWSSRWTRSAARRWRPGWSSWASAWPGGTGPRR